MPSMPTGLGCEAGTGAHGERVLGCSIRKPRPCQPFAGSRCQMYGVKTAPWIQPPRPMAWPSSMRFWK